ncbi:MAG: hypothetical protein IJE66_06255 [Akkermansia sp.]|nr:hypothetical protein [Akkermansia sp.]
MESLMLRDAERAAAGLHEPLPQARETDAAEEQQGGRRQNRQHTEPPTADTRLSSPAAATLNLTK